MSIDFIMNRGFTLLELLLVMGILAILGAIGFGIYRSVFVSVDIEEEQNRMVEILRRAKGNAIAGEKESYWGVRFANAINGSSTVIIFPGLSYAAATTSETYFLSSQVEYQSPGAGSATDVVFSKRSGTTTAATITIRLKTDTSITKTISVNAQGLISK